MPEPTNQDTAAPAGSETTETEDDVVIEDLLVEEISIDGMCGVY
jgi:mycofactocin precursor